MKHYVRILTAFFGLAALAATARSQSYDHLAVRIPYEFVVDGTTLPAGNYTVSRVGHREVRELVLSSFENHKTIYVLSSEVVDREGTERPALNFQLAGDQHVLAKIETAEHVFTIPVARTAPVELAKRNSTGVSASGSTGSK